MGLDRLAQNLGKVISPASRVINGMGVGILAAMMVLTAADVVLRYLFSRPVTGAMEITEYMMAIVVSFGLAYTAVQKGHVSVDLVISRLSVRAQALVKSITFFLCLGFFSLIAWRSVFYGEVLRSGGYTSSALYIPASPFAYVVAFGSAMLCLVFLVNFLENLAKVIEKTKRWIGASLLLVIVLVLFLFLTPVLGKKILPQIHSLNAGIVGIVLLIAILFSGMPIGIVMGLVGFLGMAYVGGPQAAFTSMGSSPYATASSYGLSVVPLFVLMGSFCFFSGLSRDLYKTAYKWLGHLPGGLAMATVGGCAGFAAVSGSSVATTATMGMVALPEMKRYKYSPMLATGCIAAGGSIGILIPPSIILVIYGILTEESIGKLFLAGFIPGILEALFYMITIYILCRMNPRMGPRGEKSNLKQRLVSIKDTWGVLTLFLLVIGGIYVGIFTPTEAAGVGAFGSLLFALGMSALGRRQFTWRNFVDSLLDTGKTTAMVFVILIGANILGYFLAITRLPFALSDYVAGLAMDRYLILSIIIFVYLFLGAIMSSMAMIVLTVPILFPVITALGFDPIWFGIIIVRVVEIGQITPPVGINVFIMQGIAKDIPMYDIFRGIFPFLIADILHVALLIAVPGIALFLPSLMK